MSSLIDSLTLFSIFEENDTKSIHLTSRKEKEGAGWERETVIEIAV